MIASLALDQSYDGAGIIEGIMNSNEQIDDMRTCVSESGIKGRDK